MIEGAGGLMVALSYGTHIDILDRWQFPVVLCVSTRLGTISHTLLCHIRFLGIAFIGERIPRQRAQFARSGK